MAGCSAERYAADADREVGTILEDRQRRFIGGDRDFSLATDPDRLREVLLQELRASQLLRAQQFDEEMAAPKDGSPAVVDAAALVARGVRLPNLLQDGSEPDPQEDGPVRSQDEQILSLEEMLARVETEHAESLTPPQVTTPSSLRLRTVSLLDCLEIAAANSRDYQTQKENVYLAALDLTLSQFQFESQYGVTSSYDWQSAPGSGPHDRSGTLRTSMSLRRMLAGGGLLVFDFTNSLVRRFTGVEFTNGRRTSVSSLLTLSFSQPLMQGFGVRVVQEPLIQSERDVVYALRDFEQFRREFAVRIATDYYDLVQQLDQIANARSNYIQVINSREQTEAFAENGRIAMIDAGRAQQSELSARDSWIRAILNYENALDRFKITLGLPLEANLAVDPGELKALAEAGLRPVQLDDETAIAIAFLQRPDFQNSFNQLQDVHRRLRIAADDLRTILDVNGSYSIPSDRDTVFDFNGQGSEATWRLGVDLDLPINRVSERNRYRSALISVERQKRSFSLSEDQVKLDVRQSLRRLEQLRQSYFIQQQAVVVAEGRVEAATLEVRLGRGQVLDALDASDSLVSSRNQLTQALVNYQLEQIGFNLNTGLMRVTERGIEFLDPDSVLEGE